jgi:hypothetical protein
VEFGESNSTTFDHATFFFSAGDIAEIGTMTNASNFCAPFFGSVGIVTCSVGSYQLVGATSLTSTAAPEPSEASLLLAGILLVLGMATATSKSRQHLHGLVSNPI